MAKDDKKKPQKQRPVWVSDETLRRLMDKKSRLFPEPKDPIKTA